MVGHWLRRGVCAAIAAATTAAVSDVQAEPAPKRLVFGAEYRPFQWPDAVQSGVTLGAYAYLEYGLDSPTEAKWERPLLWDAEVRDALLAGSRSGRRRAAILSDVTWYAPMLLPWVEGLALPLFTDGWNHQVAFELTALNVQAISVVALLTRAGHKLVARARPDREACEKDPSYNDNCFRGSFAGFPSGHVSAGLVGAGLSCAHHGYLPLLGGGAADTAVCIAATLLGVANGVARISADRHYLSDVVAGAVLGWGVGFAAPVLLHYEWRPAALRQAWTLTPSVSSNGLGVAVLGLW